jgi:acyl transferase domain-containing protein
MEPVAVVGFGLRFPQDAMTPDTFWDFLMNRKCAASQWPKDRVNIDAFRNSARKEPSSVCMTYMIMLLNDVVDVYCQIAADEAHFLRDDPSLFDAPFFSIAAPEAAALDPQQCLLLETTYQAFENGKSVAVHL